MSTTKLTDDELFAAEVCGLLEVATATVYRSAHARDAHRKTERRALLVAVDAAFQAALRYAGATDGTFVVGDPTDSGPNGLSALLTKRGAMAAEVPGPHTAAVMPRSHGKTAAAQALLAKRRQQAAATQTEISSPAGIDQLVVWLKLHRQLARDEPDHGPGGPKSFRRVAPAQSIYWRCGCGATATLTFEKQP